MGGDPEGSRSVSTRVAGARGGRRGRCWGDILSNCSYSRTGRGGLDGGGVGIHGGVPIIIARVFVLSVPLLSAVQIPVFCLVLVCPLSSLTDGMERKENEHEEN